MKPVRLILSSQYFLYFSVLGIFLPYFNLYCYHLNFSGFQIGVLASVRTLATALFPLAWGALADKYLIRRPIYIFCSFISAALWASYLLTTDFEAMLVITAVYGIFFAPVIAFLESFSMDLLDTEKTGYGKLRAWGSIGFILTVVAVGRIIDYYSVSVIIVLILAGSLVQSAVSLKIPHVRTTRKSPFSAGVKTLANRRVFVFLFCAFLMLASHGTYYGFFSIHLDNLGFSSTFIGVTWALASAAEIGVMMFSKPLFARFSYEHVLIGAFMAAALRWLILFFVSSPVPIIASQMLHAFSYGAFHMASILYIDQLTPKEAKTLGQSVNNAVTYGFGIMAGFLINGYFFDKVGAGPLFLFSSGLACAGGVLLFFNRSR